jgi:hypothetical protein
VAFTEGGDPEQLAEAIVGHTYRCGVNVSSISRMLAAASTAIMPTTW